jgi:hypothetical protein
MDREVELYKRISQYENMERENIDLKDRLKEAEEFRIETDAESEILRLKLEELDP